jgi:hypothetical protein
VVVEASSVAMLCAASLSSAGSSAGVSTVTLSPVESSADASTVTLPSVGSWADVSAAAESVSTLSATSPFKSSSDDFAGNAAEARNRWKIDVARARRSSGSGIPSILLEMRSGIKDRGRVLGRSAGS